MVLIVWLGRWTSKRRRSGSILSWALLGMLAGVLAVIISFVIGGPVRWLNGGIGLASFEAGAIGDGEPVAQVTTTTKVAHAAPPGPSIDSKAGELLTLTPPPFTLWRGSNQCLRPYRRNHLPSSHPHRR